VPWDDLPLLKYESEVFVQVGAWKNIFELESNLNLEELFLLYRACSNEFNKQVQISAMAWGGETSFDDDWYDPAPIEPPKPIQGSDLRFIPIGLGYEG